MRKQIFRFIILALLGISITMQVLAQDCRPEEEDPASPDYCFPVPLDDHIIYMVIAGAALGFYKIRTDIKKRRITSEV